MAEHIPDGRGEFEGRTALVTGAGHGIGAAVAELLADLGARVAATDRAGHSIEALAADWPRRQEKLPTGERSAGRLEQLVMDVTDRVAVENTVARVERELGPVDILVNVAGILRTGPATTLSAQDWADTFAVNTTGVFQVSQAVAPLMAARKTGCIVTVGSNAAGIPRTGMAAYAASKAAAAMFTKCLGLELARSGVRCNVVAPGSTDTAMQRALWTGPGAEARVIDGDPSTYRTGIPLGRIAQPADIADAVAFLASDRARHITLQELYVDGGATLR
ncbi:MULTISPECIES: 2,3-dihydro-2,3-dihydroxybenzoate dehydrogenase [Streptomyces]|uniref:2,3-dihydro-2,3-dihydroxybenzoate dehydrogenase n=1 Tax=Streptomyces TaxID=1883 RepID=UPI000D523E3F|nr:MULTISPECIES: 2,3-dihydro-2,3-dihydroxybenzoate dehydrogenase [Streptomyces]MXG28576.1 2,3-dihydro-2,3-dihydroxybenzoate dehydrogenase [Streptomyces sp. YIM 132580]PVC62280.1 2,3-dihydro-2,3-dihydroxybenzoate dehydrogenase [Streptomyces sp. CS065A]